jgi:hypothetical protein
MFEFCSVDRLHAFRLDGSQKKSSGKVVQKFEHPPRSPEHIRGFISHGELLINLTLFLIS